MFRYASLTCVLAFGATSLSAQSVPPVTLSTGIIGIAAAQTARLNLLNVGAPPSAVGLTCTAAVAFLDGAGLFLNPRRLPSRRAPAWGSTCEATLTWGYSRLGIEEKFAQPSQFPLSLLRPQVRPRPCPRAS
jgi:hypothetical protein